MILRDKHGVEIKHGDLLRVIFTHKNELYLDCTCEVKFHNWRPGEIVIKNLIYPKEIEFSFFSYNHDYNCVVMDYRNHKNNSKYYEYMALEIKNLSKNFEIIYTNNIEVITNEK